MDARLERRLVPPSRVFVPTDRRKTPRRARHARRHVRARPRVTPTTRSTRSRGRAVHERGCCVPPTDESRPVTYPHPAGASTSSHPIPSRPIPRPSTSRSRALTTRQKTPSRIPSVPLCPGCLRGGMGMGGVRTHESRPVNQCTHAHRRMTRGLTRDVMTTDTENHTSTTTIASSRALDSTARFFHLASTSTSRPLARAPPVGMDTVRDGTRRRIDLATRRRRRRRIPTESDCDRVDAKTRVADDRVRAHSLHSRLLPAHFRAHSFVGRARAFVARATRTEGSRRRERSRG